MRVLAMRPAARIGGGSVKLVATFDLQLDDDVAIYGMRLCRAPDGRHVSYAPNGNGGRRLATFSPMLATAITQAAIQSFERQATADGTDSKV